MSKPKKRTDPLPDREQFRQQMWIRFINTPGVLERLKGHLDYVKSLGLGKDGSSDTSNNNNSEETTCLEDDFHPMSESSRISSGCDSLLSRGESSPCPPLNLGDEEISRPSSRQDDISKASSIRASVIHPRPDSPKIPPQSPRIIVEEPSAVKSPFYIDKNIDQVPERNMTSPRDKPVQVPVIKYVRGGGGCAGTVTETIVSPRTPMLLSTSARDAPSPQVSPYLASCFITNVSPVHANLTSISSPASFNQTISANEDKADNGSNLTPTVHAKEPSDSFLSPRPEKCVTIPSFYFMRSPTPVLDSDFVEWIQDFFADLPDGQATQESSLYMLLQVHPYLNSTIFKACYQSEEKGGCSQFVSFVQANSKVLYKTDYSLKVFHLLRGCQQRNYLVPDDFKPLLENYIQDDHQVEFFRQAEYSCLTEFYITSMTASMFYSVGAWRTRRMSWRQFQKLELWKLLEQLDINVANVLIDHISYDQFYVFYVKFYQLDFNQDNLLTREDLLEYEEGRLSRKVVDRIFMSNVTGEAMTFWDWVVFLLSDIDKTTPAAMEYWFPILDSDNDGVISVADLRELWNDSLVLLITEEVVIPTPIHWSDIRTQLMDLLGPKPWSWTLMKMKKQASDKLAHLLDACLNIVQFYCNDEDEQSTRSEFTNVQKYVIRMSSNELDDD